MGPGRPVLPVLPGSPPWARLFLGSVEGPEPVRWRFVHEPCLGCGASARFGMLACPRPWVFAAFTLCLAWWLLCARPELRSRPTLDGARAEALDEHGFWWARKDGYWWRHDVRTDRWERGSSERRGRASTGFCNTP